MLESRGGLEGGASGGDSCTTTTTSSSCGGGEIILLSCDEKGMNCRNKAQSKTTTFLISKVWH